MSGRHARSPSALYVARRSPLHRCRPEIKLAALACFVAVVALTPQHACVAAGAEAFAVGALFALGRLPIRTLLRVLVVLPFLLTAAALLFVAHGPRRDVLGVSVSQSGSWAAWGMASKALLGATAAVILAATTSVPDLLRGLARLRVPRVVVALVSFMVRYLDVLHADLDRMRAAMAARGHDPRWLWQVRPLAQSVGTLFVRSYERGERIHGAMLARGFTGVLPDAFPEEPAS